MTTNLPNIVDKTHRDHTALAVLRLLSSDALNGKCNDFLMQELLRHLGLNLSRLGVRDVIALLERSGALMVQSTNPLLVFELNLKGAEIAQGLINQDGVASVSPECPY